jgi:predicted amidohydrolase
VVFVHGFPKLKLAMGQMLVKCGDPERNLTRAEQFIMEASQANCDLIVLPECLDFGWTYPKSCDRAQTIPGDISNRLSQSAQEQEIMVVAGITERDDGIVYNSAILIDTSGRIILKHRKINVLTIAQDLYNIGNTLSVVKTEYGTLAVNICADNFTTSLAIGHVLSRMGAHFIFSPSAWAVARNHDNHKQPYSKFWERSYTQLCKLYAITIVGVSNVGWLTAGPWTGKKVIGSSLAVGPDGEILAQGPYGPHAEALITLTVQAKSRKVKGTDYADFLQKQGYHGP